MSAEYLERRAVGRDAMGRDAMGRDATTIEIGRPASRQAAGRPNVCRYSPCGRFQTAEAGMTPASPPPPDSPSVCEPRVQGYPLRKEVIQPQVPLRLPCYDLVPITRFTVGASLPKVGSAT